MAAVGIRCSLPCWIVSLDLLGFLARHVVTVVISNTVTGIWLYLAQANLVYHCVNWIKVISIRTQLWYA